MDNKGYHFITVKFRINDRPRLWREKVDPVPHYVGRRRAIKGLRALLKSGMSGLDLKPSLNEDESLVFAGDTDWTVINN